MKILIIPNNTENNCYGLRNKLPSDYLKKNGHEIKMENKFESYFHKGLGKDVVDPGPIDWADVVVFNRHYELEVGTIRNLMLYAKANGKKVIYETDDLLEALNFSNPMYQSMQAHIPQVRMMATMADVCTTTVPDLKKELLKYNRNVEILPNCVDPDQWTIRKGQNKRVRVGWAGGSSHLDDILLIIDVISELQKDVEFEFVIFGLSPTKWEEYIPHIAGKHEEEEKAKPGCQTAPWYEKTLELDKKLKDIKWTHQPFVPLPEYNQKLADLNFDIGLCPLVDNRFNRCKSCIKFYEYAMVGTPTLASKVPPYETEVNYTAKNKFPNWKNKLKALIENKELREKITQEQREWVLANRDIRSNIHLWEQVYSKLT